MSNTFLCRVAVFDLDGTLLDTLEDLKNSLNCALRAHGYPERTLAEVRNFVGNGIRKLIERGAPQGMDEPALDSLHQTFTAHYLAHSADCTRPYPGVTELLRSLRAAGVKIAVVTNKQETAVKPLLDHYFPGLIDAFAGDLPPRRKKPAPDGVFAVLESLHAAPEEAVYIGDSEVDLATARAAGLPEILVSWGFRDRDFLLSCGAKTILDAPSDLLSFLAGKESKQSCYGKSKDKPKLLKKRLNPERCDTVKGRRRQGDGSQTVKTSQRKRGQS